MEKHLAKPAVPKRRANASVLSLKITLLNIKPPIWRRIMVPGSMTLADLHQAIQIVMGWGDCHLHAFNVEGRRYGDPDITDEVTDERRMTLNAVAKSGITRFAYDYDFGDNWEHAILIEKAPPATTATAYPACVGGKRNCPPDDCGGPWGYAEMLEVIADPTHPRHNDQIEWLGGDFDPEAFSVAKADAALGSAFGRRPATPT